MIDEIDLTKINLIDGLMQINRQYKIQTSNFNCPYKINTNGAKTHIYNNV